MRKRMISFLMAVSLALPFTACGASGGNGSQEAAAAKSAASVEAQAEQETVSAETAKSKEETVSAEEAESAQETQSAESAQEEQKAQSAASAGEEQPSDADPGGIVFETTDLDGNTVSSADIFSKNRITMVNIWGTFCGPCIGEMPDLEKLNGRLSDMDCGIIGVVCDAAGPQDTAVIEAAKEIASETGVTYISLLPWDTVWETFPAQFVPTTYFVDANGCIIGEPAIGARGADEYEALLREVLAQLPGSGQ